MSHLPLFLPPFEDPAELLARQDLIYVGGGSTANMLAVWRVHGIDQLLADALDRGTILYGSSAGGICRIEAGIGIDDFAAVHDIDGEIRHVVATRPGAAAHLVTRDGLSATTVTLLPAAVL